MTSNVENPIILIPYDSIIQYTDQTPNNNLYSIPSIIEQGSLLFFITINQISGVFGSNFTISLWYKFTASNPASNKYYSVLHFEANQK